MGCCGTRYQCTPNGPVAVEPDGDGWYAKPDGGWGVWYATEAEALEACPQSFGLTCGEDDVPSLMVPQMYVNLSGKTGNSLVTSLPNSIAVADTSGELGIYCNTGDVCGCVGYNSVGLCGGWYGTYDPAKAVLNMQVVLACFESGGVKYVVVTVVVGGCGYDNTYFDAAGNQSGWLYSGIGACPGSTQVANSQTVYPMSGFLAALAAGIPVGKVRLVPGFPNSADGTFDLVLSS